MPPASRDVLIRPATTADVPQMAEVTAQAYFEVNQQMVPRGWPDPVRRSPQRQEAWIARAEHVLGTDPGGCWVADVDGEVVGCALSRTRELMWILSSFAVAPEHQGLRIGGQLLAAALQHGRGCLRGMLASSAAPQAVRTYRRAGFTLHPQMVLRGRVDRSAIPSVERVRAGSAGDRDLMDSVDRQTRGAAHGPDHEPLLAQFRLAVVDHPSGSGYAYVDADGAPVLLAATNRRTAAMLMWEAFTSATPDRDVTVGHVTSANHWALDVGLEAGLAVHQSGYLALRGMRPPQPYVHHGSML